MTLSNKRPWIIGHRGVPCEAPENTISGFELAISQGADLIEIDLHMSADGQLFVIHDDAVDRTTDGTGRVGDLSADELRALDAGSWMSPKYCGEKIPTLSEVLELTASRAGIVVELKHASDQYPGIERTLVRAIESANRLDDVIVISRARAAIATINTHKPEIMTLDFGHHPLNSPEWGNCQPLARPGEKFVFAQVSEADTEHVARMHNLGYRVLSSVIKTELTLQVMEKLLVSDVDGIFTDHVQELKQALQRC